MLVQSTRFGYPIQVSKMVGKLAGLEAIPEWGPWADHTVEE